MSHRLRSILLGFVLVFVVGCGALEDWFGRTNYAEDAISYIDVSRAIERGDWTLALNPQWSLGYPLIVAATRWIFPPGSEGEWTAIHLVNLVIFVASYLSFLHLIRVASTYASRVDGAGRPGNGAGWNGFVLGTGTTFFLLWQLLIGDVSRVSPDPLICCLFFLVTATGLRYIMRPAAATAIILGMLIGLGYVVKAAFLPASFVMLGVVALHACFRAPAQRLAALSRLAWAVPAVIGVSFFYVLALSRAVGAFTLGQSGDVNYAWWVNHLPQGCHWQGGPAPFGAPIHPATLVWKNPPVFVFGAPFPVTYPPWYNIPYWYDGFHHFFSVHNQLAAIRYNFGVFRSFFFDGSNARALAAGLVVALALFLLKERRAWWKRARAQWPLYLMALGPIGVYLLIHIEPRFIVGPVIVLLTAPFLPLFLPTPLVSRKVGGALLLVLALGSAAILARDRSDMLHRIARDETHTGDPAWKLGRSLAQFGIHPGDKVAAVGAGPSLDATWACVGGVRIVAEIGNDAFDPQDQEKDLDLFARDPRVQRTIFHLFSQSGAVLVVARDLDQPPAGAGWKQVPDTRWWIHHLPADHQP